MLPSKKSRYKRWRRGISFSQPERRNDTRDKARQVNKTSETLKIKRQLKTAYSLIQFLQASLFPDKLQYLRECLEQRGGGGKRVSLKSAILAHPFATTNPPMASLIPKHQKQKGSRSWLVLFVYSFLRLGGLGLFWILCLMLVMTR